MEMVFETKNWEQPSESCVVCHKKRDGVLPQWWNLNNYYGLNGIHCDVCFEKVCHKDGKPVHPVKYKNALRKLATNRL